MILLNYRSPDPRDFGYAVFGKVTKGMDVVDAIVSAPTTSKNGHGDVPVEPISITERQGVGVKRSEYEASKARAVREGRPCRCEGG